MFRKRERKGERVRVKRQLLQLPPPSTATLSLSPLTYSTNVWPPKWWQQREKNREVGITAHRIRVFKGTWHAIHSFHLPVLQMRKLCVPWQARHRSQGRQCPLSVLVPGAHRLQTRRNGRGFDSPEPNPTSASRPAPGPHPPFSPILHGPHSTAGALASLISKF